MDSRDSNSSSRMFSRWLGTTESVSSVLSILMRLSLLIGFITVFGYLKSIEFLPAGLSLDSIVPFTFAALGVALMQMIGIAYGAAMSFWLLYGLMRKSRKRQLHEWRRYRERRLDSIGKPQRPRIRRAANLRRWARDKSLVWFSVGIAFFLLCCSCCKGFLGDGSGKCCWSCFCTLRLASSSTSVCLSDRHCVDG